MPQKGHNCDDKTTDTRIYIFREIRSTHTRIQRYELLDFDKEENKNRIEQEPLHPLLLSINFEERQQPAFPELLATSSSSEHHFNARHEALVVTREAITHVHVRTSRC